ncbi:MAG: hypothetical protein AB7P00_27410 [Sandaracinaceae bacterium]
MIVTLAIGAVGCIGMTPDDRARAALPDDGVEEGPLHRAGQPCLLCHSSRGGTGPYFRVAGTVYATDGVTGVAGVEVTLVDVTGSVHVATTNQVGNFMVEEDEWAPVFPLIADLFDGDNRIGMRSPISREGGCAFCHGHELTASSVGPVEIGVF